MTSESIANAFGYLHADELVAFKKTVETLPDNSTCINIGAGSGTSGLVFMESQKVSKLYTIDLFAKQRPEGALENELMALQQSGFVNDSRYHQIQGDSIMVGNAWNHGLVDMVFIDGDHSYQHCAGDIFAWLLNLRAGGIIALHDYGTEVWPGVKKSTDEILGKFEVITHVNTFIAFKI